MILKSIQEFCCDTHYEDKNRSPFIFMMASADTKQYVGYHLSASPIGGGGEGGGGMEIGVGGY